MTAPPPDVFNRIVNFARAALHVPLIRISPPHEAFCAQAVAARAALVVNDATKDKRFCNDPLVTREPLVRAFIGIPMFAIDGRAFGTLCAIDAVPRDFTAADVDVLGKSASILEGALRLEERERDMVRELMAASEREALYRDSFELASVGLAHTTFGGQVIRVNRRICEMLGYSEAELLAISFVDITHPDDVSQNVHFFMETLEGNRKSYRMEKRFLCKDGTYLWTSLSVAPRRSVSGVPDFMIVAIEDISVQKAVGVEMTVLRGALERDVAAQTERLRESNDAMREHVKRLLTSESTQRRSDRRLRTIADSIPAMIGYWNADFRCEFANEAYRAWFGVSPERIVGMTMLELMGERLFELNEPHIRGVFAGQRQHFERRLIKADGTETMTDAQYLRDHDESGGVRGFYVLVTDITPLRAAQQALEALNARLSLETKTDYLTGLSNRREFTERSAAAFAALQDDGTPYGLILLDLDDFKAINDEHGHESGDLVLRATGRALRDQMRRPSDVVARLGGEEFGMLCSGDISAEALVVLAERLRVKIEREVIVGPSGTLTVTSSFGIALGTPDDRGPTAIFSRADAALYQAKLNGKNRIEYRSAAAEYDEKGR